MKWSQIAILIAVISIALLLLSTVFVTHDVDRRKLNTDGFILDADKQGSDPDWIGINDVQGLQDMTGDGQYYLENDIVFEDTDDHNGGFDLLLVVDIDGEDVIVSIHLSESGEDLKVTEGFISLNGEVVKIPNDEGYAKAEFVIDAATALLTIYAGGSAYDTNDDGSFAIAYEGGATSGKKYNSNGNFTPVSDFRGKLNGNGHIIIGLRSAVYSSSDSVYAGLFGSTNEAEIKNLAVADGSITAVAAGESQDTSLSIGGIVGDSISTSLYNCYNTSTVSAAAYKGGEIDIGLYAGGVAGYIDRNSTVEYCYNAGIVEAVTSGIQTVGNTVIDTCVGGVIGYANGNAYCCFNTGPVTSLSVDANVNDSTVNAFAGGISGESLNCSIMESYNTGRISGEARSEAGYTYVFAGGITGNSEDIISDCFNIGDIKAVFTGVWASSIAGGIAGYFWSSSASMANCYNAGEVAAASSADYTAAGGIVGFLMYKGASVIGCQFLVDTVEGNNVAGEIIDQVVIERSGHKTDEEMKTGSTFDDWNFTEVWSINEGDEYPVLQKLPSPYTVEEFSITITSNTGGTVTPNGIVIVQKGDSLKVTFSADSGYRLENVSIDGSIDSSAKDRGYHLFQNVGSDHTLAVTFEKIPVYTITTSSNTGGTVTPEGNTSVREGGNLRVTFSPDDGYEIANVIVDGVSSSTAKDRGYHLFSNVNSNHTLTVEFEKIPIIYLITVVANGEGHVFGGGEYYQGEEFTISAEAEDGHEFVRWTDGDTSSVRTMTAMHDATYVAVFEPIPEESNIGLYAVLIVFLITGLSVAACWFIWGRRKNKEDDQ